jgi:hypothetical protein
MRSIQDTGIIAVDESDAGVGTECRRQFLNRYGFRVSTTFWNVLEIALRDSVVFSQLQTVLSKFEVYCTDDLRTLSPILLKRIFPIS